MSTPNYKCNEINAKGHLKAWNGGPHGWMDGRREILHKTYNHLCLTNHQTVWGVKAHHYLDDKFLQVRSYIIGGVVFKTFLATRRSPSKQKHRSPSPINVAACNWWGWFSWYKSLWEKHLVGYNNKRKYLVLLRAEFRVLFQGINHDCWSQSPKKIIIKNIEQKLKNN